MRTESIIFGSEIPVARTMHSNDLSNVTPLSLDEVCVPKQHIPSSGPKNRAFKTGLQRTLGQDKRSRLTGEGLVSCRSSEETWGTASSGC
jgi:hypothetical protein